MALQDIYKAFLAHPDSELLSDNASLHYITTLTTINSSAAIAKHNTAHQKVLRKKEEKILNCIEGADAVCLDVETTIEFLSGGGAYLPGLDDNFVADRTVIFPVVSGFPQSYTDGPLMAPRYTSSNLTCSKGSSKSAYTGIRARS